MDLKQLGKRISNSKIIQWSPLLRKLPHTLIREYRAFKYRHGPLNIENQGTITIRKYVSGEGNSLIVEKGCVLHNTTIHIIGNNNTIIFHEGCTVGTRCSFWIEGNGGKIEIGAHSTFTCDNHLNVQEKGRSIILGEDCMISNHVTIRTSDSHPIYSLEIQQRLNAAKDVIIGNHVWLAPHTTIMKGAVIDDGSIIGSHTMVTKHIPSNCLAVGYPAKVVKENVYWTREEILF